MDARFERVWHEIATRRKRGERLHEILGDMSTKDLIAALAAAGEHDVVTANVIATHMLNRQARAPFLGAFLVSITTLIVILVADLVTGGELFQFTAGPVGRIAALFSAIVAIVSGSSFLLWRGAFPGVRAYFAQLPRRSSHPRR